MRYIKTIILSLLIPYYSCFDLSTEYRDVNYFTPKIVPSNKTVIVLKNIHSYIETGNPGGNTSDEIFSDWYLVKYDLENGYYSETKINTLHFSPFLLRKGITSATDKYVSILNEFSEYIVDINTLELRKLQEDLEIEDAFLEQNDQNLIMIEGFYEHSIFSYNIENHELKNLFIFDFTSYFGNLSQSYVINSKNLFLWNNSMICIIDVSNKSARSFDIAAEQIIIYDSNKAAILKSDRTIVFYSFTSDTIFYEGAITLKHTNPLNFSISQAADFLVYQTGGSDGMIIYLDIISNKEQILFINERNKN